MSENEFEISPSELRLSDHEALARAGFEILSFEIAPDLTSGALTLYRDPPPPGFLLEDLLVTLSGDVRSFSLRQEISYPDLSRIPYGPEDADPPRVRENWARAGIRHLAHHLARSGTRKISTARIRAALESLLEGAAQRPRP